MSQSSFLERRRAMAHLGAAALCWVPALPAWSQAYPAKALTIVVPFAAGGSIDVVARQIASRLSARLGQSVVADNVAGAFGTIGTEKVARAAPDGRTLLFVVSSPLNVAPILNPSAVRYDAFKDFLPIATVGRLPVMVVGRTGLPADSMAALIQLARARPGALNFGTDGTGSLLHITGELIKQRAGVDIVHVPYKAAPQVLTDIAGGQLDLGILPVALAQPLVREGRVRAYAVTSPGRLPGLPQVPALAELPGFDGVSLTSWMGLLAPAGVPAQVATLLTDAMKAAASDPALVAQLVERAIEPDVVVGGDFAALLRSERQQIAGVVARTGLKPE
ncbi:tripartite tricarboxylate transporter substrate binding protein [uncultured Pseudacidovorax sp.]|uniref:Bug family tripartite tricarboxylate transporter substrate binding protein n=1 Tax=uncultured Pseudacidovorax sp. TaxID=679313 RepID=UPI002600B7E5|nr:tripartite tricarboxylate transporter substrate binding protein [uncultured Pseudacidovorax sp.]